MRDQDSESSQEEHQPPASDEPEGDRQRVQGARGIALLCLSSAAWVLLSCPALEWLGGWDQWEFYGGGLATIAMQSAYIVATFVVIGFAGSVPLLYFSTAATRACMAIVMQSLGWCLFLLGMYTLPLERQNFFEFIWMATSAFLFCVVGGFVPLGWVILIRRWRLAMAEQSDIARPVGIVDFLTITAAGAAILAFHRELGLFSDDDTGTQDLLIIILFYTFFGTVISSALLVVIRVVLGPSGDRFNALTITGIATTICLAFGVWAVPIQIDGPPDSQTPIWLQFLALSMTSWLSAAFTSACICIALHRCGLRLRSHRIDRQRKGNQGPRPILSSE